MCADAQSQSQITAKQYCSAASVCRRADLPAGFCGSDMHDASARRLQAIGLHVAVEGDRKVILAGCQAREGVLQPHHVHITDNDIVPLSKQLLQDCHPANNIPYIELCYQSASSTKQPLMLHSAGAGCTSQCIRHHIQFAGRILCLCRSPSKHHCCSYACKYPA